MKKKQQHDSCLGLIVIKNSLHTPNPTLSTISISRKSPHTYNKNPFHNSFQALFNQISMYFTRNFKMGKLNEIIVSEN